MIDSVRKLNEIKGMKGLGRYFKQIAQSARTHDHESVDDFMGTLEILLAVGFAIVYDSYVAMVMMMVMHLLSGFAILSLCLKCG